MLDYTPDERREIKVRASGEVLGAFLILVGLVVLRKLRIL
jgi:hypothetical protein